eukprot:1258559-Rhodomonas_salina.1
MLLLRQTVQDKGHSAYHTLDYLLDWNLLGVRHDLVHHHLCQCSSPASDTPPVKTPRHMSDTVTLFRHRHTLQIPSH